MSETGKIEMRRGENRCLCTWYRLPSLAEQSLEHHPLESHVQPMTRMYTYFNPDDMASSKLDLAFDYS